MIVPYTVLVLSVIAGNVFVQADDTAASASAPSPNAAAPAAEGTATTAVANAAAPEASAGASNVSTTNTVTAKAQASAASDQSQVRPQPNAADVKATASDNDDAPMADNYNSYLNPNIPAIPTPNNDGVDRERLAATLDRITKVLDANVSPAKGTAAVPLLPGKNYDFFLLKVPKRVNEPEVEKPAPPPPEPRKDLGRRLDLETNENSMSYPLAVQLGSQATGQCPCAQPPSQIAPDLSALQSIYGSALGLNTLLNPVCPPGLVPVVVPNTFTGIPVDGLSNVNFNGLDMFNQYSPNPPQFPQYPNPYPTPDQLGPYPQNPFNVPLPYPQNGPLIGNPMQYPPPVQPFGQPGLLPLAQPPINSPLGLSNYGDLNNPSQPFGPLQQQLYPSQYGPGLDFPGSFAEYNRRNEFKSATKSLF